MRYFNYQFDFKFSQTGPSKVVVSASFPETKRLDKEVELTIDFNNQSGKYTDNYSGSEFKDGKSNLGVLDKNQAYQAQDFNSWVEAQYKDILNQYVNRAFEDKLFDLEMARDEEGKSPDELRKIFLEFLAIFATESIQLISHFKIQHLPHNLILTQNLLEGHGEDLLVYPDNDEYEEILKLAL